MSQQFSRKRGKNITALPGNREVRWMVNHHAGVCLIDKPLDLGDFISLCIDGQSNGGGHVFIGFTTSSDRELKNTNEKGKSAPKLSAPETQIRVKGNKVRYTVQRRADGSFEEQVEGSAKKVIKVAQGKQCRLTAEIMFGKLSVHIERSNGEFRWDAAICGENVFVTRNRLTASLINGNPQACCALDNPLATDCMFKLELATASDVSWWTVLLFISTVPPSESEIDTPNFTYTDSSEFIPLIKLKNPMKYLLMWFEDGELSCKTEGNGSPHVCHIPIRTDDQVFIYFEILRLSMTVSKISVDDVREKELDLVCGTDDGYCMPHIYEEIQDSPIYTKPSSVPVEHDEEKCETMLRNMEEKLKNRETATDRKKYQIQKFINQTYSALKKNETLGENGSVYTALSRGNEARSGAQPLPRRPDEYQEGSRKYGQRLPEVYLNKKVDSLIHQIKELNKSIKEVERRKQCSIVTKVKMDWL